MLGIVAEAMDDAALDEHTLAGANLGVLAIDPPRRDTRQSIDGLVPPVVMVRHRHAGIWLHRHLEHVNTAFRVVLAVKEPQFQTVEAYRFWHPKILPPLSPAEGCI